LAKKHFVFFNWLIVYIGNETGAVGASFFHQLALQIADALRPEVDIALFMS